ncbi:hypothetical protein [Streptosporangium sp. NPDC002524]|uniref:hypothetical protein n=1 Tax=Streptosporangium sp. NPDC002524 TaxID=3154537 RepID=UPI00331CD9BE
MAHAEQVGPPVTFRPREHLHRPPRIDADGPTASIPARKTSTTIGRHPDVTIPNNPTGNLRAIPDHHPNITTEDPGTMPGHHLNVVASNVPTGHIGAMPGHHPDVTASNVPAENPGTMPGHHLNVVASNVPTGHIGAMPGHHPDVTASNVSTESPGTVPGHHLGITVLSTGVHRGGSARLSVVRHRRLSRRSQRRRHIAEPSSARRRTGPSQ